MVFAVVPIVLSLTAYISPFDLVCWLRAGPGRRRRGAVVVMLVTMLQSSHGQEQKPGLEDFSQRSLQGIQEFGIIVDYSDLPGALKAAKSTIDADVRNHLAAHPKLQHAKPESMLSRPPFSSDSSGFCRSGHDTK